MVFHNIPIRRVMDISKQNFAHKIIKYAKYTVEREHGQIYTFTNADLINICAYYLSHLHRYVPRHMENRREFATYLRRVVTVMRVHIKFNSQIYFEIGLQLRLEKIALTNPKSTHESLEHWEVNSVITRPLLRFVFMDDGMNKVFRI